MHLEPIFHFVSFSQPFVWAAAVYASLNYVDRLASLQVKKLVSNWLKEKPSHVAAAIEKGRTISIVLFSLTFDIAFGSELLSWRRAKRSWAISSVVVVLVTLLWGAIRPDQFMALFNRTDSDLKALFGGVVLSAYLFNLIPDYISAVQTQYFVRIVRERQLTGIKMLSILIADVACKTIIFLFFYCLAVMVLFGVLFALLKDIREVWDKPAFTNVYEAITWFLRYGPSLSVEKIGNPSIGIFYYSTFFPSVWLWLLIISLNGFRTVKWVLMAFFRTTTFLQWVMIRGDERPFQVVGIIVSATVFVAGMVWRLVSLS
jgi:hypothetical protein